MLRAEGIQVDFAGGVRVRGDASEDTVHLVLPPMARPGLARGPFGLTAERAAAAVDLARAAELEAFDRSFSGECDP